jgi:hypothetical protein
VPRCGETYPWHSNGFGPPDLSLPAGEINPNGGTGAVSEAPEWIIVNANVQPPRLECTRCGATEELRLPMSATFLIGGANAWAERHNHCELP